MGAFTLIAVPVEKVAPRLWRRLSPDRRPEIETISRLLSTTQEFANSGFPQGTNHGLNHVAGVLHRADELVSRAKRAEFNDVEAYLLLTSILLHDSALFRGREEHADEAKILEVIGRLDLPIERALRIPVARIAAAHSGFLKIEELPSSPIIINPAFQRANLRAVAAALRISDEVAEDGFRASAAVLGSLHPKALPYHEMSTHVLGGFDFSDDSLKILIQLACDQEQLLALHETNFGERTFLSFFLDRCIKIESERSYCCQFLPKSMQPDAVKLRILDNLSSPPWIDCLLPSRSSDLRSHVYHARPSLLLPNSTSSYADLTNASVLCIRECLGDDMTFIVTRDREYLVVARDNTESASGMLRLVLEEICSRFSAAVFIKTYSLSEFFQRLAWGDPWIIALVTKGVCMLPSREFESASMLCSQPLRFSRCALRELIARDFLELLNKAERASSLSFQLAFTIRGLMMLAQILVLSVARKEFIRLAEVQIIGELNYLVRRLKGMRVPRRLRESFIEVAAEARNSMTLSCWMSEPSGAYLEILHEWSAFVDRLVPEARLNG